MNSPEGSGAERANMDGVAEIGRKARRNLFWSFGGILIVRMGSFAIGLILARLLSPADFGVYAIALAAMTFALYINGGGIIAACVQWRGNFDEIAPTGALIAVLSSILAYGILWFTAPAFADLSGVPEATPVVRLLTLVVVVDGIAAVSTAALIRRFEQSLLTRANIIGISANAAIAIPLGLSGAGAYSFAAGQLVGSIVMSVLAIKFANLPLKIGFDTALAKRLLRFGFPLVVSLAIDCVLMNADYVIVGNVLGAVALGYYMLAFNISTWVPSLVGAAVRYVAIPAFSRLAEHGTEEIQSAVQRLVPLLIGAIVPAAVVIALLGPQLVHAVYGEKWAPAAVALQCLTVLMVVRLLTSLALDVLIGTGFVTAIVWMNALWAVALVPALWVGTSLYGIRGTAIAHGIVAILVALPMAVLGLRRVGLKLTPVLPALIRPAIGAVLSALVIIVIDSVLPANPLVELFVGGGTGTVAYLLIAVPPHGIRQIARRLRR